jgi:hypothetical protein
MKRVNFQQDERSNTIKSNESNESIVRVQLPCSTVQYQLFPSTQHVASCSSFFLDFACVIVTRQKRQEQIRRFLVPALLRSFCLYCSDSFSTGIWRLSDEKVPPIVDRDGYLEMCRFRTLASVKNISLEGILVKSPPMMYVYYSARFLVFVMFASYPDDDLFLNVIVTYSCRWNSTPSGFGRLGHFCGISCSLWRLWPTYTLA